MKKQLELLTFCRVGELVGHGCPVAQLQGRLHALDLHLMLFAVRTPSLARVLEPHHTVKRDREREKDFREKRYRLPGSGD